jgi:putative hydrolase of the HAD superfamily
VTPSTVVFDLGAVLLQWQPVQLVQRILPLYASNEAEAERICAQLFGGFGVDSAWAEFDRGTHEPAALAEILAARTGVTPEHLLDFIQAVPDHLHTLAETAALLPRLSAQGHRLVYLSNMPAPYADRLLAERDFFHHFEDGIFSARVGLIKPEHGIFALAETQFGLDPARTVFIDDNAHNVASARERGWSAIQFFDAAQCEAELRSQRWLD